MLFILWGIAMQDQFIATLGKIGKVVRMITSISTDLVGFLTLLVVGVMSSPSPA
jgi:hypothetical protein